MKRHLYASPQSSERQDTNIPTRFGGRGSSTQEGEFTILLWARKILSAVGGLVTGT